MFEKVQRLMKFLENYGEVFMVGGCVRDRLLGLIPKDYDLCTNIEMSKLEELFETVNLGKNKDFGILAIKYEGEIFEIAHYRNDGKYSDNRRPDSIDLVNSVQEDLSRRDFTINAIAMDYGSKIIDPFRGTEDIKNKIIRTVGNPDERFQEDFLRMLRCIRFANRFDFQIEKNTWNALVYNAYKIKDLCEERVHQELFKMSSLPNGKFAKCIEDLFLCGMLQYIYPEIDKLKYFQHSSKYHPESTNVLGHVIKSLEAYKGSDPIQNFSVLFHDIGKSETYVYKEEKGHTYYGHDKVGSEMIQNLSKKYKWPNDLKDILSFCALNHMKYFEIPKMAKSKILNLLSSPFWSYLKETSRCDTYSRCVNERFKKDTEEEWNKIEESLKNLKEAGKDIEYLRKIKKEINGDYVMKIKGIESPSKEIGYILKIVVDAIIDKNISLDDKDKIDHMIKSITYKGE